MGTSRITRFAITAAAAASLAACSSAGQIGDILGSVLGGGATAVAGTIRGVNTSTQQISLQQTNGQTVALGFDANTKVVYQGRTYTPTALESGDQVTARVTTTQSNTYYTDSIEVTQPAAGSTTNTGGASGTVQTLQGTVQQIDRTNGWFTIAAGTNVVLTVSMPYGASSTDVQRFQSLRSGDFVRFSGVYLNNSRVELRSFN